MIRFGVGASLDLQYLVDAAEISTAAPAYSQRYSPDPVGESGRVLTIDTSRGASRAELVDLPQVQVITDSARRALAAQRAGAEVAVLDPRRSGAGRGVIDLLAAAEVSVGGPHRL